MNLKEKIYLHYTQLLHDKILTLRAMISELSEDAKNDAKGSAGDKHETALAMMHIEQEKLNKKLKEAIEQKTLFDRIDPSVITEEITKGSLVKTDKYSFFMAVALPKINVDGVEVIAISLQSPLGSKLLGLKKNQSVSINDIKYTVEMVQ